jgi:hypothetical protein
VVINGKINNSGADITPLADAGTRMFGGQVRFVVITCTGDVTWTGGAYRPAIYGPQGGGDDNVATRADLWNIMGKLNVGGNATVGPVCVGANGNQQLPPAPAAGQWWKIIEAAQGMFGGLPGFDPAPGWAMLQAWPHLEPDYRDRST